MVTSEALKLLYKKLGGNADVDNITAISEMVDLIEDVAGGGGGASGLLVRYVDGNPGTLDKSYTEIKQSLDNGIIPVVNFINQEDQSHYDLGYSIQTVGEFEDIYVVALIAVEYEDNAIYEVENRYFKSTTADGTLTEFNPEP